MYRLANRVKPEDLRKYGFRPARELPDHERWCDNDYWYDDMYLIPMDPDSLEEPYYADEDFDQLIWEIHIMPMDKATLHSYYKVWLDMTPSCTYHIDNHTCEVAFYTLFEMIRDGVIVDDWDGA